MTRIRLFGGRCAYCGERAAAEAPAWLKQGSPSGRSTAALVARLAYAQAIGLERLAALIGEVFGLSISEGAISNILAHARSPLTAAAEAIRAVMVASPVLCPDETSAQVSGKIWWEWVFIGSLAVLYVIRPSRDTAFSALFHRLLLRAVAIGRRRGTLQDTTPAQYRADLDRRLDSILAGVPQGGPGRKLCRRLATNRAHLFVFVTDRRVPAATNISKQHLRPSVIFRTVIDGFRCEWGTETHAALRSVVNTAKANHASVLDVLRFVLAPPLNNAPAMEVG